MPPGITSGLSGPVQTVLGVNPGAGAEFTVTVPPGKSWLLYSVTVLLVQGATDTPRPILVIDDGTNVLYESFGSSTVQAVNTTCRYCWAPNLELSGQVGATTNVHSQAPLTGGMPLGPGYKVRSSTIGIAATGDYGIPAFTIVEYG